MPTFVNETRHDVNLSSQDEFPQQRHGALGGVGHHAVPAVGEPFEPHEVTRQGSREIRLAFDRVHRIVLTPDHQGRTPDPVKLREQVERIALAARFGEPLCAISAKAE